MKIAHIIYSFNTGGAETMLVDIVNYQVKLEHEISIIIVNESYNEDIFNKISKDVHIILINRPPRNKNPFYIVKLNIMLYFLNPDIIHSHNNTIINILFIKTSKYLTVHDTKLFLPKKRYLKYFTISKAVSLDIKERYNINSIVVYNGIRVDSIIPKEKTSKKDKDFKIIQISRLESAKKGQDILIEAISILKKEYNIIVNVDILGIGKDYDLLKEQVEMLNLSNEISFLGYQDRKYIYSNLCKYNLLVQPSRNEGFGLTIVEAMVAKVPVLVSDIEGPMEIIQNGKYGFYFKSESVEDLTKNIYKIINMPIGDLKNKVENAYIYAVSSFDIKETAINYINNY